MEEIDVLIFLKRKKKKNEKKKKKKKKKKKIVKLIKAHTFNLTKNS